MLKIRRETELEETDIGEIPDDWEVRRLGDILEIKYGKGLTEKDRKSGGVPVFGSSGVVGYHVKALSKGPGLVIGRKGNIGSVYLSKSDFFPIDTVFYSENIKNAGFLYYILTKINLEQLMSDSAVPGLNIHFLESVRIPYPQLHEQSRIATVLSWFDDLIQNKKTQNEILEKTAMAICRSWFIEFESFKNNGFIDSKLGKIPRGWAVKSVHDLADIFLGGTPRREKSRYWNGQIRWAAAKDVANTEGIYVLDTAERITEEGLNNSNAKILSQDSLVITARGTVGELRLLGEGIAFNQTCYGLVPKDQKDAYFLFLSLRHIINEIKALSYGTVFDTITIKTFNDMKVLVPPQPILEKFHSIIRPLFHKILLNQKQVRILKEVRDVLLPLLVFGKLRVEEI